jgi:hypothetical protein
MSGGVNGLELDRRARALRPGLPVLLKSGDPSGSVEKCNFPILQKPYRREQWAMHIRSTLGDPSSSLPRQPPFEKRRALASGRRL